MFNDIDNFLIGSWGDIDFDVNLLNPVSYSEQKNHKCDPGNYMFSFCNDTLNITPITRKKILIINEGKTILIKFLKDSFLLEVKKIVHDNLKKNIKTSEPEIIEFEFNCKTTGCLSTLKYNRIDKKLFSTFYDRPSKEGIRNKISEREIVSHPYFLIEILDNIGNEISPIEKKQITETTTATTNQYNELNTPIVKLATLQTTSQDENKNNNKSSNQIKTTNLPSLATRLSNQINISAKNLQEMADAKKINDEKEKIAKAKRIAEYKEKQKIMAVEAIEAAKNKANVKVALVGEIKLKTESKNKKKAQKNIAPAQQINPPSIPSSINKNNTTNSIEPLIIEEKITKTESNSNKSLATEKKPIKFNKRKVSDFENGLFMTGPRCVMTDSYDEPTS
jgi:hypothetical protein